MRHRIIPYDDYNRVLPPPKRETSSAQSGRSSADWLIMVGKSLKFMKRIKVLADFNGYLPPPERQFYIGTITEQFGNIALRHGWKVIEIYER